MAPIDALKRAQTTPPISEATTTVRSKLAPDQEPIERDGAAAMDEEKERGEGPHQGVFEAGLVPEIAADAAALVVGHDEEEEDREGGGAREQTERQQRPADGPRDRDRPRPQVTP